eukprot:TRINITY_DN13638_c0_g2_i2.p1 TRINITY_DN13638_c0_g2~~TRINITY_DN13638_c0_g2_i2.p1  ORF type:complete len:132 (-),score=58.80 TRINITY_DN13638_c0_g2_i2:90-458(-)
MATEPNTAALDQYARGWGRGDTSIIYPSLDTSFTFIMTGMEEPVKLDKFQQFFVQFRKDVEAGGGPGVESDVFMKFTNVIRRQVGATLVEAAKFEVPGFATGCYLAAACGGKVLWEEAAPDS